VLARDRRSLAGTRGDQRSVGTSRDYTINLWIVSTDTGYVTLPQGGDVGPSKRHLQLTESGVWRFSATLSGNTLRVERIYTFSYPPAVGTKFVCEGFARDILAGVNLQVINVTDSFGIVSEDGP